MRRYRNLHPTFSKVPALPSLFVYARTYSKLQQIHKIPGTAYASSSSSLSASPTAHVRGLATQGGDWDAERELGRQEEGALEFPFSTTTDGDANFKAKMEALHDPTSTNLYMEGWVFFSFLGSWFWVFGFLGFCASVGRFLSAVFFGPFFFVLFFCVPFFLCRFLFLGSLSLFLCLFLPGVLALLTLFFCLVTLGYH